MAARMMTIELKPLDGAVAIAEQFEAAFDDIDGSGKIASTLRNLHAALQDATAVGERIDDALSRIEDEDGVALEDWDAEWPMLLELRVDLAEAMSTKAAARRVGSALVRVLVLLGRVEGSRACVRLGRQQMDLDTARREIAGRASLLGVVIATDEQATDADLDDEEEEEEQFDDEEEDDNEDEDDDDDDDDEEDGFPTNGFGDRGVSLHPDEAWVLTRLGARWPCGPEILRACRRLMGDVHPDKHLHRAREANEDFIRAQRGTVLLRARFGESGAHHA